MISHDSQHNTPQRPVEDPFRRDRVRGGSRRRSTQCRPPGKELDVHNSSRRGNRQGAHRLVLHVCVLTLAVMLMPGLSPIGPSRSLAADTPDKGGTVVWAVHEFMPSFDIMYETSYIAGQPLGPLYNGLADTRCLRPEPQQDRRRPGRALGGRGDGTRITFRLRKGVKFHDGSDFHVCRRPVQPRSIREARQPNVHLRAQGHVRLVASAPTTSRWWSPSSARRRAS